MTPAFLSAALLASAAAAAAQGQSARREFRPGAITRSEDLPPGRLRLQIERLPLPARERALEWLRNFHFTEQDLNSLHSDPEGALFYVDTFPADSAAERADASEEPPVAAAAVPISPLPSGLVFHSRPGAPNVIYLNFVGATVTNTAWNTSEGQSVFRALPFSTDTDFATFSDAEQTAIKRIWQRVAEDYASFNVDVTTERPAAFTTRTAMALITRSTDETGAANPSSNAGGIAYINVFANSSFSNYRPAWVYHNNLGNSESHIAEAASHEIGHNLGLSHDGLSTGADYYNGHGSGETSWAPIMGTGYNRNVSQWSRGEYYLANNTQDDLAVISGKLTYVADDHGDTPATATAVVLASGTNIVSTTPENDPANTSRANKGILQRNTDLDFFSFSTGAGLVNITARPWVTSGGTRGGNLDLVLELRDAGNTLLATNNPASQTGAQIQMQLPKGDYFVAVRNSGAGTPLSAAPNGYTSYGSVGQYFLSGTVAPTQAAPATVELIVTVNNPEWGSVSHGGGTYPAGTSVQVSAFPANYFKFDRWTNGVSGTNPTVNLVLTTNTALHAVFGEALTTNSPTPQWWLASHGFTNFEAAVNQIGANQMPVWQSYVAGLNPNDPAARLEVLLRKEGGADVLSWNAVTGRVYSLSASATLEGGFSPLGGATNLPATVRSFTNNLPAPGNGSRFYRLEVQKP